MEDNRDLITSKTIAVQVADQIRDDILSRSIKPGSRITVKEIADRYNVSAMPVREAFNMLCGEQFLELNPYKGATVMAVTPELMAQLNDLQGALEGLLVELCLQKGYSDELLDQLEAINQELASLDEQGIRERRIELNARFHTLEYSPCKDHMAYAQFQKNLNQLHAIRRYQVMKSDRVKETVEEHRMIIRALRRKDVSSAVVLTKMHTKNAKYYALTSETYDI